MSYKLILTEKPSVARDFANILGARNKNDGYIEGNGYLITWCVGHLVAMSYPEKYGEEYKKWDLNVLPFLPTDYKYEVINNVAKQFKIVKSLMNSPDVDVIYYAGDSGREGQSIAELVRRYGGVNKNAKELRVWIDSYTEETIKNGIRDALPMSKYDNLGNAGIMRGIEDYAMGINFSRALTLKYGYLMSDFTDRPTIAVGRVMTCVLGMIVSKEWEIRNFKESNYFTTSILCNGNKKPFEANWKVTETSKFFNHPGLYKDNGFLTENDAKSVVMANEGVVLEKTMKKETKKAPLLFNLAELQSKCSSLFHIAPHDTLNIAQSLYEKGLTTYPRTDARVLSTAVLCENEKKLRNLSALYPAVNNIPSLSHIATSISKPYVDDSKITDHYAIIPTGNTNISDLNDLERKVFDLICRRYISIFFPPAVFDRAAVTIDVCGEKFYASGKVLVSAGYLEASGDKITTNDDLYYELSLLNNGDKVYINDVIIKPCKTSPPNRYNSGSIILAMENAGKFIEEEDLREQIKGCGIGTSATRAEILKKLVNINYIALNKKTQVLTPTELGETVCEIVKFTIPSFLSPKMTASWEKGLADIENGVVTPTHYKQVLENYIKKHIEEIKNDNKATIIGNSLIANQYVSINSMPVASNKCGGSSVDTKIACPVCGKSIFKNNYNGKQWYSCEEYKNGCKFSVSTISNVLIDEVQLEKLVTTGKTDVINDFYSDKKHKYYSAELVLDAEYKVQLNFQNNYSSSYKKSSNKKKKYK